MCQKMRGVWGLGIVAWCALGLALVGCDPKKPTPPPNTTTTQTTTTAGATTAPTTTSGSTTTGGATTYTAALRTTSEAKSPLQALTLTLTPEDAAHVKLAVNGGEATSVKLLPRLHYEGAKEPAGVTWLSADPNVTIDGKATTLHLELRQADGALSGYWELGGDFLKPLPDDPETRRPTVFGLLHATPGTTAPTLPDDDKLHCAVRCTVFARCGGQGPEQCNSSNTCFGECYDAKP